MSHCYSDVIILDNFSSVEPGVWFLVAWWAVVLFSRTRKRLLLGRGERYVCTSKRSLTASGQL